MSNIVFYPIGDLLIDECQNLGLAPQLITWNLVKSVNCQEPTLAPKLHFSLTRNQIFTPYIYCESMVVLVPQIFWTLTFKNSGKNWLRVDLVTQNCANLSIHLSHTPLENLVNYWQNLRRLIFNKSVKQVRPINHSPFVTEGNYEKSSSTKWDIKLSSESNTVRLITPGGQRSMNQIPLNLVKIHEGGHWCLIKYIILKLTQAYQPWPSCEVILNNPFVDRRHLW